MNYIKIKGRRVIEDGMRVFNKDPSDFYKLKQPFIDYSVLIHRLQKFQSKKINLSANEFENKVNSLIEKIQISSVYSNLLNGVFLPFAYERNQLNIDLGTELEEELLPNLHKSFIQKFPDSHFKAVLQSNTILKNNIFVEKDSRYDNFIAKVSKSTVVGIFFPQVLQEFDIKTQRMQMQTLPATDPFNICLSGGIDVCSALTGFPELLISSDFYTPILTLSSYEHNDKRLILLMKAYGANLEFWCMTQMLTPSITQVSEQWTGGLTFYD